MHFVLDLLLFLVVVTMALGLLESRRGSSSGDKADYCDKSIIRAAIVENGAGPPGVTLSCSLPPLEFG
jgi:hypothetical protein